MPSFSQESKQYLSTCDERLQRLFNDVIKTVDCKVTCGHRSKEAQDAAYYGNPQTSKTPWPKSKHNSLPSKAVDVAPYPVEWPTDSMDRETYARALGRWYMFVGYVRCAADRLGIRIRCGADWDGDFQVKDQNFHDLPHFEVIDDEHA